MALSNEDYSKLEEVVLSAATDSELSTESETQVEEYVDPQSGRKRHNQRTRRASKPDIALAMKLLDQRIGGPQDYC